MAIQGTYIFDKIEGETIDELYERKIETAYYMIDNIIHNIVCNVIYNTK